MKRRLGIGAVLAGTKDVVAQVQDGIIARLAERYELAEAELDPETLALAERLESDHIVP